MGSFQTFLYPTVPIETTCYSSSTSVNDLQLKMDGHFKMDAVDSIRQEWSKTWIKFILFSKSWKWTVLKNKNLMDQYRPFLFDRFGPTILGRLLSMFLSCQMIW